MAGTTFVLGAGFSVLQQFPLVRGLKERVIHFLEAERHVRYEMLLEPGNGGHDKGQFYAGLDVCDKDGSLQFEELLIELRDKLNAVDDESPCYVTFDILKVGCSRLLWCIQNSIWSVESPYRNFAQRVGATLDSSIPDAIISFNWDLLAERALTDEKIPWSYSSSYEHKVPILKPHGSINWSGYLRDNLKAGYGGWCPIAKDSKVSYDSYEPLSNPDKQDVNSKLHYVIYPGDPDTPAEDADVTLVWEEAKNVISARDTIVFMGYSLPEYDTFALQAFKELVEGKEVRVFNPSKTDLARYEQAFGARTELVPEKFEHCPYAQAT